ncbi:amino acid ABC transporter permease [Anaeromicropila populeti]|uniref:Putative lysine transport system permease protein n=1 Tax=Anaeromicropila populeti TaxID=37658 RepID=A0A1I6KH06_9FIRM|nr:amino acid ABC transporter permease [Anaeromicropila populeti]SFR90503.1 putative lysine transport system permease protein [Anaeromicropila populeti]
MEKNFFEWLLFLVKEYYRYFLQGTWVTLVLSVVGTLLGFLMGFLIGIIQSAPVESESSVTKKCCMKCLKGLSVIYIEIFRGTPMIVQAMVIYYGSKQAFQGLNITSFQAAIIVVTLNTGAYMAETVRGGILSIDKGQEEGAKALGMTHFATMFTIILPQAFRNIFPEMGNLFITNLKMTSVLNVIGVSELYFITKTAANTYYKYFESYMITGLIYFVLVFIFTRLLRFAEKKMEGKNHYKIATEFIKTE